ncbi:hypothetical protein HZD82_26435, partial [Pantoea agglomerans]|uniref:hypothetical protein n=1 Tax=Enterobacter agglomerans TaxID=549 RepID=UPI001A8ED108
QIAMSRGVIEAEFAERIHALFTTEQTCVVGYNNVRFDDEVMFLNRDIFYLFACVLADFTVPAKPQSTGAFQCIENTDGQT